MNNPVRLVDPDGRKPGDFFKSKNQAALDWGKFYNAKSINEGKEYGSTIYEVTKKGKTWYTYTAAATGESAEVTISPAPEGSKTAARIHSHGKYDEGMENDDFSSKDKWNCYNNKVDGYLASPDGSLQKYDVNTATTTTLSTSLPSDQNDPQHKNDNDARNTQTKDAKTTQTIVIIPTFIPKPELSPIKPKEPWILFNQRNNNNP